MDNEAYDLGGGRYTEENSVMHKCFYLHTTQMR